jgi:hypothetical protein
MTKPIALLCLATAAVVLLGTAALLAQRPGGASVTWSRPEIRAYVAKGYRQEVTVSFRSTSPLEDIALEVVPELRPFVSLEPGKFATVPANQDQTVIIAMVIPASAEIGTRDGTIHVRSGTATVAKPLAVSLTIDPIPLPPDPGEEGKRTLPGIDSDADGVRDDVQRYVLVNYLSDSAAAELLLRYARSSQLLLTSGDDAEQALRLIRELDRISSCWHFQFPDGDGRPLQALEAEILNTRPRLAADFAAARALDGRISVQTRADEGRASCLPLP